MIRRTVTEEDLGQHKNAREAADRGYNGALTALDAAVQGMPELPPAPPGLDETQLVPLNERWSILEAPPALPAGWRGRVARFVWGIVEPMFARQQAFNATLVEHVNRNAPAARAVPATVTIALDLLRQQAELSVQFQSRLIQFAQQITPYVDTKDYELHQLARRINEDALEASARVGHRLHELLQNELPYYDHRLKAIDGVAAGMSGLSDEMLKRFESSTARVQRFEAGLREVSETVASLQQLTQTLRRSLERHGSPPPVVNGPAEAAVAPRRAEDTRSAEDTRRGGSSDPPDSSQQLLASDPIHSQQYVGFENLYRGSEADIRARMVDYAAIFAGASDVLDIGCGRGELLRLLEEQGVPARGIDLNHEMIEQCRLANLDATEADALSYLRGVPDESLGGLIATQVVEHLPPDYLLRLLTAAFDKLRPGAAIILETINPSSWAAFFDSYIRDLTHVRPVHPDTLKYLVTASGFADATIAWRSPYPQESKLQLANDFVRTQAAHQPGLAALADTVDRNAQRLNSLLFTYMDYAIVARRP